MLRCSRHFLSTLVLASALGSAHAAELGEARVSSHIGQALVADIELAMVDDPAQTVSVRVASPEVYNGAGIALPPVLASLNLSVMRRDGRQFLHLTSLRPVDSDHLHLYLELVDKGQRTVRLATLWLTPDPNPAPLAAPVAAPAPAVVPAPVAHAEPAPRAAPMPALARKPAEEEGTKQPAPVRTRLHARKPAETAQAEAKAAAVLPLPIHGQQSAAPAACVQQAEQAKVCAALDDKNAALQAKLGALEGKVKSLQATLGAAPAAAESAAAAAHAAASAPAPAPGADHAPAPAPEPEAAKEAPGPKPIGAIKPLVPRKPKTPPPEPESGLPWGWIGGAAALLLALGGAGALLRRRVRTVQNVDMPAEPRLLERLRQRFASRTRPAPAAAPEAIEEAVEPTFE
ncbi:FimV family protein [Massilia aerilata]|uniref:FimV family protein n=1 Tax=Massilia aerilata TaxID=453817 RepID=A0ABW0RZM5_9BURK